MCRWQLNQGALSISECNFWVEADCYIFFNNNVYVCFIFNIVVIMLFGKNMFICDWKITVIWAFEHFMFAVQFVSNDNYTVINFIFGSIFSKIFLVYNSGRKSDWIWWEFQYFDLNSDWFGQNQNLSTNILNVNRSKLQPSDRNQSKFWISDRFGSKYHRSKTPRMVFKNFEAWFWRSKFSQKVILTDFVGQNFDRSFFDRLSVGWNNQLQALTDRSRWHFDQRFSNRSFSVKISVKIS